MSESSRSIKPRFPSEQSITGSNLDHIERELRCAVRDIETMFVMSWSGEDETPLDKDGFKLFEDRSLLSDVRRAVEAFSREALQTIALKERDHDAFVDMVNMAIGNGHRTTTRTLTRNQILWLKRMAEPDGGDSLSKKCERALEGDEEAERDIANFWRYHEDCIGGTLADKRGGQ